jgi:hypothetical protein
MKLIDPLKEKSNKQEPKPTQATDSDYCIQKIRNEIKIDFRRKISFFRT